MTKNILCNVRTKRVHKIDFLLKVHTESVPNYASFVSLDTSYFSSNIISSDKNTNYLCTLLLKVKENNT